MSIPPNVRAWAYAREVITTHPFNALTLVIAFGAVLFAGLSWWEARKAGASVDQTAKEQVNEMRNQVDQMKRAATAQLDGSIQAGKLVYQAERAAGASEDNAKASRMSLEALVNHYRQEWLPRLEVSSVSAEHASDDSHTAITLIFRNIGGDAATDITFSFQCEVYESRVDSEGHKWYQQQPSKECQGTQEFPKALIGRNDEFRETEAFYPPIPEEGVLRLEANTVYHSEEHSTFHLQKCFYVANVDDGHKFPVADCYVQLDLRPLKQ